MERFKIVTFAVFFLILGVFLFYGYTAFSSNDQSKENLSTTSKVACESEAELKSDMRKLWEDHIVWTRNTIFCLVDELPGTEQSIIRQHQNQVDIGNAIKPYYGDAAGKKLTALLTAHINISLEVIKEGKTSNTEALVKANKKWYINADEIAAFFCKANPNLNLVDMKMMMKQHLDITTEEVFARIKKNYPADVVSYDKIHSEILGMADILSEGIIKQFPHKFETCKMISMSK